MIPTSDDTPSRTLPMMTIILIVANALAFVYVLMLAPVALLPLEILGSSEKAMSEWNQLEHFFQQYTVIPARYFSGQYELVDLVVPIFTSMFLHGDLLHLGGNMLYLWIYGDNVEDRMGHVRFLFFYLLCGVIGTVVHILISSGSTRPTLGASGAISGILGAYILLFPEARVKTLIGGYGMFAEAKISARMLIGFWFVIQVFYGTIWLVKAPGQGGGVAWWAHIYGFVAGLALVHVFKRKDDGPAKPDLWPALYSNEK